MYIQRGAEVLTSGMARWKPSHGQQPMESGIANRALVFGFGQPVPGDNCYVATRARWKHSECAVTKDNGCAAVE